MCTDTDTATDPDTEMFVLIEPCSDLFRTVRVNGWACPLFSSLRHYFPPFFPLPVEKTTEKQQKTTIPEDQQNHERRNGAAHGTGPRKCSCMTKVLVITVMRLSFPQLPLFCIIHTKEN